MEEREKIRRERWREGRMEASREGGGRDAREVVGR